MKHRPWFCMRCRCHFMVAHGQNSPMILLWQPAKLHQSFSVFHEVFIKLTLISPRFWSKFLSVLLYYSLKCSPISWLIDWQIERSVLGYEREKRLLIKRKNFVKFNDWNVFNSIGKKTSTKQQTSSFKNNFFLLFSKIGLLVPAVVETVFLWPDNLGVLKWKLWKNLLLIAFALIALVSGTVVSVLDIVKIYTGEDEEAPH